MDTPNDNPSVLLLERDADVIQVAQRVLRRGIDLHVANSVELAVRVAERRPLVIAVLDATMTGLNPMDTVAKLRAHRPGLRIIFLAVPSVALDRRYGQIGPVLRKPITIERFSEAVRYALRLQGMSIGIQRMHESSGSFQAVRLPNSSSPLATPETGARPGSSRPRPSIPPPALLERVR